MELNSIIYKRYAELCNFCNAMRLLHCLLTQTFLDYILFWMVGVPLVAAVASSSISSSSSRKKKVFSHPTMGGVILRLGALSEPWESENTSEDLRRS